MILEQQGTQLNIQQRNRIDSQLTVLTTRHTSVSNDTGSSIIECEYCSMCAHLHVASGLFMSITATAYATVTVGQNDDKFIGSNISVY